MKEHNLDLSGFPEIGNQTEISNLLSGERELRASEIRALSIRFGVSLASF